MLQLQLTANQKLTQMRMTFKLWIGTLKQQKVGPFCSLLWSELPQGHRIQLQCREERGECRPWLAKESFWAPELQLIAHNDDWRPGISELEQCTESDGSLEKRDRALTEEHNQGKISSVVWYRQLSRAANKSVAKSGDGAPVSRKRLSFADFGALLVPRLMTEADSALLHRKRYKSVDFERLHGDVSLQESERRLSLS